MRIVVTTDGMLAGRKMKAKDLAGGEGLTEANLWLLRTGKVKGVAFETLVQICKALEYRRGDLLDVAPTPAEETDLRRFGFLSENVDQSPENRSEDSS